MGKHGYEKLIEGRPKRRLEGGEMKKWSARYAAVIYEVEVSPGTDKYVLAYAWKNIHGNQEFIATMPCSLHEIDNLRERGQCKLERKAEENGYEEVREWAEFDGTPLVSGAYFDQGIPPCAAAPAPPKPKPKPQLKLKPGPIRRTNTEW